MAGDCRYRFVQVDVFSERAFAGHPTIGTAWVLATHALAPAGADRCVLDEEIGPVPVELEGDPRAPRFVWMRHREATFDEEVLDRDGVAAALGLKADDLLPGVPIQAGSTGNAFLYVPLRDRETVDRVVVDARSLRHCLVHAEGATRIVSEQGTKMRRQSFVHVALGAQDGASTDIRVGGSVVPVIDGALRVPAA